MRLHQLACLVVALSACQKNPAGKPLVSEVRQALDARDRALGSYHFLARSTEGTAEAEHEFFFRSPNRSKGVVTKPPAGTDASTTSFDGTKLYRLTPAKQKLEVFSLKLPVEKASYFLASTFTAFVPEGFRAPLLPSAGLTAKKVSHPRAPDAVELSTSTHDETGAEVTMTYVLRFPSADFLGKRVTGPRGSSETVVTDEQCEPQLKLCVPRRLESREQGAVVHVTELTKVEFNPSLPNDDFTLTAPAGFTTEPHEVVEQGL